MMKLSDEQKRLIARYGHLFNNTGGNDIIELIERQGVTYFNNPVVAELQGCCYSQLILLQTFIKHGHIVEDGIPRMDPDLDCMIKREKQ